MVFKVERGVEVTSEYTQVRRLVQGKSGDNKWRTTQYSTRRTTNQTRKKATIKGMPAAIHKCMQIDRPPPSPLPSLC